MPLSILTDEQIRGLLENLTREELGVFQSGLSHALHEYSTGTQAVDDEVIQQPMRSSIRSSTTGATTLFMPSSSPVGHGVKVITLPSPGPRNGAGAEDQEPVGHSGAITIFGSDGRPKGFLQATTLTGFRTALASSCLLTRRENVRTVTVFGCGDQAYWHVRLALMLKGSTIRTVNIINHRFSEGCKLILSRFYSTPLEVKRREGWQDASFGVLTPGYGEYARLLEEQVRAADVIFCCTPSTVPLFDAEILTSRQGRRKGRLIVAIGSYTPQMREIPVELLKQAVKAHEKGHHHHHKHAAEGGVIIVDTLDGVLKEAGEIIEAHLDPKQLVEVGEIVMLRKLEMEEAEKSEPPSGELDKLDLRGEESSGSLSTVFGTDSTTSLEYSRPPSRHSLFHRSSNSISTDTKKQQHENQLARWLQEGNVIYKSVGFGLMDLAVGTHVIEFAREKGVGSHVEGF